MRVPIRTIARPADAEGRPGTVELIDYRNCDVAAHRWGEVNPNFGAAAVHYTREAGRMALAREIDGMVSAPLNKEAMHAAGHPYEGQTEILGELTGTKPAMLLLLGTMRLMLFTNHMALRAVCDHVRRDRRLKLTIAGVMLTVLSVLIVIMGSSVVKQILANIVAPIEAADHQELITVSPQTTTRTVAATGGPSTPGSSGSASSQSSIPIAVAGATVYDPQGSPPADYESYVDRAFDGDLATFWPTWVYKQQFGPRGIKDGVGLMLTFSQPATPKAVTLSTTTPGTQVEIRSAASPTAALDDTTVLGTATLGVDPVAITLTNAPASKNLVVWITKLAPYQGDTAANKGQFQSTISEISITR